MCATDVIYGSNVMFCKKNSKCVSAVIILFIYILKILFTTPIAMKLSGYTLGKGSAVKLSLNCQTKTQLTRGKISFILYKKEFLI